MLDLIRGFRVLQVDLAFPQFPSTKSSEFYPGFDLSTRCSSTDPEPGHPARPARTSGPAWTSGHQPGHPAPDSINSILHSVYRLTFVQFCSGAHIHFRIPPPFPHSTTIAFPATNSDNFDPFCFENLSCGFRILLCFGYLGTVRQQHHHRSSSPRTTTNGYIGITFTSISSWYSDIIILSCICIDNPMALLLHSLPIETSL